MMRQDLELLQGAIDLHVHSSPCLFERLTDHAEAARQAKAYGFRAIIIKAHHFGTVGRAHFVRQMVDGIDVFDCLPLNRCVGGVNPFAVDAAIKLGVKKIFMPTVDAYGHQVMRGGAGQYDNPALRVAGGLSKIYEGVKGIYILNEDDNLLPEVKECIDLIAKANIILCVGHLSLKEIWVLVKEAPKMGVKKFPVRTQVELAEAGCYINQPYAQVSPRFHMVAVPELADAIRQIGVKRCVISSDTGQVANPPCPESIRIYVRLLLEEGFGPEEIRIMLHENPGWMIYG
jgi:hypothetical protein